MTKADFIYLINYSLTILLAMSLAMPLNKPLMIQLTMTVSNVTF